MLKPILAIIGGVVIAFVVVFLFDTLFHRMSAVAVPTDMHDKEAMRLYVASHPPGLLVGMVAGWTVAALAGSFVAARFGERGTWPGWVVTVVFLLATVANFLMVTHPVWMVAASVVAILAAGWFGAQIGARSVVRAEPVAG